MTITPTTPRRRNMQDATLINIRALKTAVRLLTQRVKAIERTLATAAKPR